MSIKLLDVSYWATCLLALAGLSACGEATQPNPSADMQGKYVLRMVEGWPLPYFDYQSQHHRTGGTLDLNPDERYVKVDHAGDDVKYLTTGDYSLRDGRIVLAADSGHVESYTDSDGILEGGGTVYLREGREIPQEYRWRLYRLHTCDGEAPSYWVPCSETSARGSHVWLGEDGQYHIAEDGAAATHRWTGTYGVSGEEILMAGMPEGRQTGILRNDTLALGTWVYVRLE